MEVHHDALVEILVDGHPHPLLLVLQLLPLAQVVLLGRENDLRVSLGPDVVDQPVQLIRSGSTCCSCGATCG